MTCLILSVSEGLLYECYEGNGEVECICSFLWLSHLRIALKILLCYIVNLPFNGLFFIISLHIHNFSVVSK